MKKRETERLSLDEVREQPKDLNTERVVLATLMRYNEKFAEYSDMLGADLFYWDTEKAIYRCIEGVISNGNITDINSLYGYAKSHDVGVELYHEDFLKIYQLSSTQTLDQDIKRLHEMSMGRMSWIMLQQSAQKVLDMTCPFDEEVNNIISSVGELQTQSNDNSVATFGKALKSVQEIVMGNLSGRAQALHTGFKLFDDHYLLRPQTLTIIAAFPAVGKSALSLNIAVSVARQGVPCAYYSLEMDKSELASRAISETMELPSYIIMNRQLNEKQMNMLDGALEAYKDLPIFFDDRSTVSFDRVIRSIRTLVKTNGIKLAIIDYLQIFNQTADDEERGMSYMARACKNIAKETGIAVIALSQLNRSALHPSLRMLRGSGQIEESADNVVLIDRPEAYPDNKVKKYEGDYKDASIVGTAKLILAKGRGVGTGSSLVAFNGKYTRFSDIVKPKGGGYVEHEQDMPF